MITGGAEPPHIFDWGGGAPASPPGSYTPMHQGTGNYSF